MRKSILEFKLIFYWTDANNRHEDILRAKKTSEKCGIKFFYLTRHFLESRF